MYFNAHAHSSYSVLDGHALIPDYIDTLVAMGHTHAVLTDHGTMAGLPLLWKEAKDRITPVAGCEVYITTDRKERIRQNWHLTLIALNRTGYENLTQLSSQAWLDGYYHNPRIDHELLARYSDGIACLSGCLGGELAQMILRQDDARCEELLRYYHEIFGDRFFLELQNHGPHIPDQITVNKAVLGYARKYGMPALGTNDSHFCHQQQHAAHKLLVKINSSDKMNALGSPYTWVRSNEEMYQAFGDSALLRNTLVLQDMIDPYDIATGRLHMPISPWENPDQSPEQTLRNRVEIGLLDRLNLTSMQDMDFGYEARMNYELNVIHAMGQERDVPFERYFLNVGALVEFIRSKGILYDCRGSAAGSIVCWALGISSLDPVRDNLMFERFLNPHRIELPDIDIDIADDRRDDVLVWLQQQYGVANVARIGSYAQIGPKRAMQDVAKLLAPDLSRPYQELASELSGLVPHSQNPGEQTLASVLEDPNSALQAARANPEIDRIVGTALEIEGRFRQQSTHAAGIVISDIPITKLAPVMRVKDDAEIIHMQTQYEMGHLEQVGLVKFDLLGLGELSKMHAALQLIYQTHGILVDIYNLPEADELAWEVLSSGDTLGLFQLGGRGMTRAIAKIQPRSIAELAMVVAAYRPGAMANIDEIAARKAGLKPVISIHPTLDEILAPTYGIPVIQEQLVGIVAIVAGFSPGEADKVRKAMGKKDTRLLASYEAEFKQRGLDRGYTQRDLDRIWDYIKPFANYGFNKAHAYSYAHAAFRSAYLKAHYPQLFYAAAMTVELRAGGKKGQNTQSRIGLFIDEAQRRGITVLPPSINHSQVEFIPEGENGVRFGLDGILNVATGAAQAIAAHAPYANFAQLVERALPATKKDLTALIWAGAIPWGTRATQFQQLDQLLKIRAKKTVQPRKSQNETKEQAIERGLARMRAIFQQAALDEPEQLPELPLDQLVQQELMHLGMVHSRFPEISGVPVTSSILTLGEHLNQPVSVTGILAGISERISQAGNQIASFTLMDHQAQVSGLIWPSCWSALDPKPKIGDYVLLTGKPNIDGEGEGSDEILPPWQLFLGVSECCVIDVPRDRDDDVADADALLLLIPDEYDYPDALALLTRLFDLAASRAGSYAVLVSYRSQEERLCTDLHGRSLIKNQFALWVAPDPTRAASANVRSLS